MFRAAPRVYHDRIATQRAHQDERRVLHEIVSTVGSSLELDDVLDAVVRLLSDASAVHACFVYLLEDGDRLVLKAASEPYGRFVDAIALERGEGLAWWAVEQREPGFIPDNALDDPRSKHVPELDDERFQSLLSVPIFAKDGEVIGVITLHSVAPREFTEPEIDFLSTSASLVAGAIENARLYDEMRRRVDELEHLTELGETIAAADSADDLLPAVATRCVALLRARACHLYLLDAGSEELQLVASAPTGAKAPPTVGLAELGPELGRSGRSTSVAVPLVANDELLGLLRADGTSAVDLARAAANNTAVALKKIELIERLTEKNVIRDFFEQLAGGTLPRDLEGRAARLGFDLSARYLVLVAAPPDDGLEKALARLAPGSLFDRRDDGLRALLRVPGSGVDALVDAIRSAERPPDTAVGISNPCRGAESFAPGFEEATHALLGSSIVRGEHGVMTYEELGPYKYLLRMSLDGGVRDSHRDAVARLAEYDRQRQTSLLRTLEEFLRRRGNISASAAALYIHPNTLRQRLRRVHELTGIDLRRDDWLMVEIAVKIVKLQDALGTSVGTTGSDTRPPGRV